MPESEQSAVSGGFPLPAKNVAAPAGAPAAPGRSPPPPVARHPGSPSKRAPADPQARARPCPWGAVRFYVAMRKIDVV
ncbi:hypothetical protein GCM10009527_036750 [Actinomadura nitritigenes]